jgi:hypothetical protein
MSFGEGEGMKNAPAIGAVGKTLSVLAPDGQAEFSGGLFQVRAREGSIDSGRLVVVTGFDPWSLIVSETAPVKATAQTQSTALDSPGPTSKVWRQNQDDLCANLSPFPTESSSMHGLTEAVQHRVGMAIVCLHISAVLYLLIGLLMFPLFMAVGESREATPIALFLLLSGLVMVAGIEVVVYGLHLRKFWAWVAGIVIFGLYVPSLFLPLGAFGLWGLLDEGSRAELGIGGGVQSRA